MKPTPDSSVNRRSFVKKTLATTATISFAGLIRAHGEESGGTTTWNPDVATFETTGSGGTTTWNPDVSTIETTDSSDTTTWDPHETTIEATHETTQSHTPKEWVLRMYANFNRFAAPPSVDNSAHDLAQRSGKIYSGVLYCILVKCTGETRTISYPIETGGYCDSNHLDLSQGSDTGIPPGKWLVARGPKGWGAIPSGHQVDISIQKDCRDAILVHGPIRNPGTSGCIAISNAALFYKWSQLMRQPRCSATSSCRAVDYDSPVELVVKYTRGGPIYRWKPANQVVGPKSNPYPPYYINPAPLGLPAPITRGSDEP